MIWMNFAAITKEEMETISRCLRAVESGPFFPDWEFHLLFGLERSEIKSIADRWPNVNLEDEIIMIAVNNSLNNLCGYPHRKDEELVRRVGASRNQLRELLKKIRNFES